MCGIAGVLYSDTRPVEKRILQFMSNAISHRGPDAEGIWIDAGIGLAHRRLSIIDLAGGDQPIANEDGSIQVIFNGEIYNYEELRDQLLSKGHTFRTQSDTEVLVHLYEEEGANLVNRLRGMFAFALWDSARQKLLLARDRLGIKPLYVYRDQNVLVFGSEIKALLAHPDVPQALNYHALEDYLTYGFVPGPGSIFQHIEKLQPAHVLSIAREDLNAPPTRYWQLQFEPDHHTTLEQWLEQIEAKLQEVVRIHLIADVPVGAFLSGGIDSSMIVASSSGSTRGALQTFSMGFADSQWSELPYARQIAKTYNTQHTEEIVTPNAVELLDQLTHFYDEPFADSSALPTFLVSKLAASHVKVALSGDGGDECFGGYARYAHDLKEASLRSCLPGWFRHLILRPVASVWPRVDWLPRPLRLKNALTNLSLSGSRAYANTLASCRLPLRRQLLHPELRAEMNGHDPANLICQEHDRSRSNHPLDGMLSADTNVVLPDDFLVKVDRASMANGLEVRPPLLDHELMELAARIPADYKVRQGETKWIFKELAKKRLPHEIVERRKQGFELPMDAWLRESLRPVIEDTLLKPNAPVASWVDQKKVENIYRSHCSGRGRHGQVLWSLLMFARWCENYLSSAVRT